MKPSIDAGRLASDLAGLPGLDRQSLMKRWRQLYEKLPPANSSRTFLVHGIACRMQEQVSGGLKPATRKLLTKIAKEASAGQQVSIPTPTIKPGTRLLREWHGHTYEVTIVEDGVIFKDKHYKSLSEVARIITGVKWSGPLFFGLKKQEAA